MGKRGGSGPELGLPKKKNSKRRKESTRAAMREGGEEGCVGCFDVCGRADNDDLIWRVSIIREGVNADRTTTAQQQVLKAFILDRRHGPSKKHTKIPVCKALAIKD